jgi:hypothetical protein
MNPNFFETLQANLLAPTVLFFVLGIVATLVRSDLRFPEALYHGLTIYLLAAIGFKGGVAIAEAGIANVWLPTMVACGLGAAIPLWCYPLLRWGGKLSAVDAAAVAGHYGSVSAVTFIAATTFLQRMQVPLENYSAVFLAVMESPAIIVSIAIGKLAMRDAQWSWRVTGLAQLREALFGRSIVLLLGSLVVGTLCGSRGMEAMSGFFVDPFQGLLALFLLELGMVAARRLGALRRVGVFLLIFGVTMPLVNGTVGVLAGKWVGLSLGGATLLGVLAASASYIAAPAAMRVSLPDANPTLYLTASLVITFPFNITVGIPIYYAIAQALYGSGG